MNRVVVTGIGAVSSVGIGAEALWQACVEGKSAVKEVVFPNIPAQKVKFAAPLAQEAVEALANPREERFQDIIAQMARMAAREAVEQAGLDKNDFGDKCGVVIGSGFGGARTLDANYIRFAHDNAARYDPMAIPKIMNNASTAWVAMEFGATGPAICISTACASGAQSIGLAMQLLRAGAIERCLTGGAEATLVDGTYRAWETMRVMSPDLCRPFSKDRNGLVLGEGAGVLVLETLEAAQARGAEILAEMVGYGTSCDAGDLLRPNPTGAARAISQALAESGLAPSDIGYVNAHGTGTIANDVNEVEALRRVFGQDLDGLLVSSTKPIHGHTLGAAGALEMIVTLMALRAQMAPPTINYTTLDPKVDIDPVSNTKRPLNTRACMSNSFAFGGINATLIVAKAESAA